MQEVFTVIVYFKLPDGIKREEIIHKFEQTTQRWKDNQDLIRTVIDQCEDHHRELGRLASEYTDATTALEGAADEEEEERQSTQNRVRVGMLAHHQVRRDATDAARDGTGRDAREDSETDSETDDDRSMRRRC